MGIAHLVAVPGTRVRVTSEDPPRYAIVDLMRLMLGDVSQSHVSHVMTRAKKHLDLAHVGAYKFAKGKGSVTGGLHHGRGRENRWTPWGVRAVAYRATGQPQTKAKQTEDLYVMRYSFDETAVKIGASNKTQQRRCSMQASQNFWMETLAIFPGKGRHEIPIHGKLQEFFFFSGRGADTEWFDIHVSQAVGVVSKLIQELEAEEAKASEQGRAEDA